MRQPVEVFALNGAIWQAIETLANGDPEWSRTCGHMVSGIQVGNAIRGRHVSWFDGIGGEDSDAFGTDVGTVRGQFTLASASKTRRRVDEMCKATIRLFLTRKLHTADMLVGHVVVNRNARVVQLEGRWEAQLDASVTYQGAAQVPAFLGRD